MRITFVDAGSAEFTRNVVTDLGSCLKFDDGLHLARRDSLRLALAGQPAPDPNTTATLTTPQAATMPWRPVRAHRGLLPAAFA